MPFPTTTRPVLTTCTPRAWHTPITVTIISGQKQVTFTVLWGDIIATAGWLPRDVRDAPTFGEAEYILLSGIERGRLAALVARGKAGPRTAARAVSRPLAALGYAPRLARLAHAGHHAHVTIEYIKPPSGRPDHHGSLVMLSIA